MDQSNARTLCRNLNELVKKFLLAFCEVNVAFTERLDVYGSIQIRADDTDVSAFLLNEHCYRNVEDHLGQQEQVLTKKFSDSHGYAGLSSSVTRQDCQDNTANHHQTSSDASPSKCSDADNAVQQTSEREVISSSMLSSHHESFHKKNKNTEKTRRRPSHTSHLEITHSDFSSSEINTELDRSVDCVSNAESESNTDTNAVKLECDYNLANVKIESTDNVIDLGSEEEAQCDQSQGQDIADYSSYGNSDGYNDTTGYSGFFPPSNGFMNHYEQPYSSDWKNVGDTASSYRKRAKISTDAKKLNSNKICGFCLKSFTSSMQLRLHIQRHHKEEPIHSLFPAQAAETYSSPVMSMAVDADRQLTCSVCSLTFKSLDGLRCHENSKHSQNKFYRCQFCEQTFLTRQAAYTHRVKFHRVTPKKT